MARNFRVIGRPATLFKNTQGKWIALKGEKRGVGSSQSKALISLRKLLKEKPIFNNKGKQIGWDTLKGNKLISDRWVSINEKSPKSRSVGNRQVKYYWSKGYNFVEGFPEKSTGGRWLYIYRKGG
jgi:hypothetical protein